MSGAFSIYKREHLIRIGGFLTSLNDHPYIVKTLGRGKQTVTEDMEIVIRLWRYFRDQKRKVKAVFLPSPVCWTEVPDNAINLYKQRVRWHLGLLETLLLHRKILFEPKYKSTGLIAMPYYFFFELMSPLVKVITIVFLVLAFVTGLLNAGWVILLLTVVLLTTAIIIGSITAIIERWSHNQAGVNRDALRYNSFFDWLWMLFIGIIGDFSYAFFRTTAQFMGLVKYFRSQRDWNKFERKGIKIENL
jgi:cellulose synthase/poly-beta-1,6-N-acetylglucosamine synthase-like glycosyltransferase